MMTPQQQDRCREMYLGGIPEEQVARALGVNTYEVRAAVREQPSPERPQCVSRRWTRYDDQRLIRMLQRGEGYKEAAKVLKRSLNAIAKRVKRLRKIGCNIPARTWARPILDLATGETYPSAQAAAEALGMGKSTVSNSAWKGYTTRNGHTFQYVEK